MGDTYELSGWEKRISDELARDAANAAVLEPPYAYATSGSVYANIAVDKASGNTLDADPTLIFSAKGSHNYWVDGILNISNLSYGTEIEISISGTNSGATFNGWFHEPSGNTWNWVTGTSFTFSANTNWWESIEFRGMMFNGTLPVGLDFGTVGLYWRVENDAKLSYGSRINYFVEF